MTSFTTTRDALIGAPWWSCEKGRAHDQLNATVRYLQDKQKKERDRNWLHYALYSKEGAAEMGAPDIRSDDLRKPVLALNVVRSCVNTIVARIIQSKPKPTYLTLGQNWTKQQQVKAVDAFAQGAMYHAGVPRVATELCMHAAIAGTGCGKILIGPDGKPAIEHALVQELLVDRADGRHRRPRVLFHYRPVARDVLLADPDYAAQKRAIESASNDDRNKVFRDDLADQVSMCEVWRLPSRPGAEDGRHIIALDNCTLVDEPWRRFDHPFVFLRWGLKPEGMWGYGVAEQLRSLQYEINRLLLVIQEQMIFAGPKVFVQRGSNVNRSDITNKIWDVIEYTGSEPKYVVFQSVSPEMFSQLDRLYSRAFDEIGVSLQAVRGEKPPGVTAGVAIRTVNDLQTGRLVGFGQDYEQLHVDIADQFVDLARDWFEGQQEEDDPEDGKKRDIRFVYPARSRGRRYLAEVSASDIKIARDEYLCQVFPTSALAHAPGERMQQVSELRQDGTITPIEARYLLDFPDLDRSNNLALANYDAINMAIDRMLDDGDELRPEPWTDLDVAVPLVGNALQRAQIDGVPETRWQLLANYLSACQKEKAKRAAAAQPAPPPPGQGGGAPPGGGGAGSPPPAMAA